MGAKPLIVWFQTGTVLFWALDGAQIVGVWFRTHMHVLFILLAS